jgi:hypothetical protein
MADRFPTIRIPGEQPQSDENEFVAEDRLVLPSHHNLHRRVPRHEK